MLETGSVLNYFFPQKWGCFSSLFETIGNKVFCKTWHQFMELEIWSCLVFSVVSPWTRCGWKQVQGFLISFTFLPFMNRQRCVWNSIHWCVSIGVAVCFYLEIPFQPCPRTIPGKQRCDLVFCQCCWEHLSMLGNFLGNRIYSSQRYGRTYLDGCDLKFPKGNPLELYHQNNTGFCKQLGTGNPLFFQSCCESCWSFFWTCVILD